MNNTNQKSGIARYSKAGSITKITMPDKQKNQISDEVLELANVLEKSKPEIDRQLKRNMDIFFTERKKTGQDWYLRDACWYWNAGANKKRPYLTKLK